MTWSKFGEEFGDAARDLSDAAFRTHVEAVMWSNRRLLDLVIPRKDVKRFAETDSPDDAIAELVFTGWWQDVPDGWYIGCRFSEWQLESAVVEVRRDQAAQRQRRHRMHAAGDHSLCTEKCAVTRDEMRDPVRSGTDRTGTARDVVEGEPQPAIPEDDPETRAEWEAEEARLAADDAA